MLVGTIAVSRSEALCDELRRNGHHAHRAQRQAPRAGSADHPRRRPEGRGHDRDQHGGPRHRHQARPKRSRRSAACTCSAPSATRAGASTTSCAVARVARAIRARAASSCRAQDDLVRVFAGRPDGARARRASTRKPRTCRSSRASSVEADQERAEARRGAQLRQPQERAEVRRRAQHAAPRRSTASGARCSRAPTCATEMLDWLREEIERAVAVHCPTPYHEDWELEELWQAGRRDVAACSSIARQFERDPTRRWRTVEEALVARRGAALRAP